MKRHEHFTAGDGAIMGLVRVDSRTRGSLWSITIWHVTPLAFAYTAVCSTPFSDRRRQTLLICTPLLVPWGVWAPMVATAMR